MQTCKLFADLERLRQETETKNMHERSGIVQLCFDFYISVTFVHRKRKAEEDKEAAEQKKQAAECNKHFEVSDFNMPRVEMYNVGSFFFIFGIKDSRTDRVNSWREFNKGGSKISKGKH